MEEKELAEDLLILNMQIETKEEIGRIKAFTDITKDITQLAKENKDNKEVLGEKILEYVDNKISDLNKMMDNHVKIQDKLKKKLDEFEKLIKDDVKALEEMQGGQ